jgi:amylosucrase
MHLAADVVCPGTLLLGEVVMEPSKVVPYFDSVDKPECQMLYNVTTMASTWNTVATRDVRMLRHQLEAVFALPKQYTFLNYLRCHDDIGWGLDYDYLKQFGIEQVPHKRYLNDYLTGRKWGSDARGELYNDDPRLGDARLCGTTASLCGIEAAVYEKNEWKLKEALHLDVMLHAFILTQSGIPVLYSGDEIGQLNDYSYHNDPLRQSDSRWLHRGDFDWKLAKLRKDPKTRQGMLYEMLEKLIGLRSSHKLFDADADVWVKETWNDHVLGIGRYKDGEKLIALFNFSEDEQTAWIDEEDSYVDLLTGEPRDTKAVVLPSHDFLWLYHSFEEPREIRRAPAAETEKKRKKKKTSPKGR